MASDRWPAALIHARGLRGRIFDLHPEQLDHLALIVATTRRRPGRRTTAADHNADRRAG